MRNAKVDPVGADLGSVRSSELLQRHTESISRIKRANGKCPVDVLVCRSPKPQTSQDLILGRHPIVKVFFVGDHDSDNEPPLAGSMAQGGVVTITSQRSQDRFCFRLRQFVFARPELWIRSEKDRVQHAPGDVHVYVVRPLRDRDRTQVDPDIASATGPASAASRGSFVHGDLDAAVAAVFSSPEVIHRVAGKIRYPRQPMRTSRRCPRGPGAQRRSASVRGTIGIEAPSRHQCRAGCPAHVGRRAFSARTQHIDDRHQRDGDTYSIHHTAHFSASAVCEALRARPLPGDLNWSILTC